MTQKRNPIKTYNFHKHLYTETLHFPIMEDDIEKRKK